MSNGSPSWKGCLPDPYTGNGYFWRLGWRCAPSSQLSVKSHLERKVDVKTILRYHTATSTTEESYNKNRKTYYMNSWLQFCARCRPIWSLSRSCWGPWRSAGGCISSGSPSWIRPVGMDSGPLLREETPGRWRARAPAPCPAPPVCCWRSSWSKKPRRFPLRAAGKAFSQMLCCPGVWRQFLFKAPRVPLLLTSFELKKKMPLAPKADVRVCCSGRATSTSVCLSRCSRSDNRSSYFWWHVFHRSTFDSLQIVHQFRGLFGLKTWCVRQ